jgi:hypothetical protein
MPSRLDHPGVAQAPQRSLAGTGGKAVGALSGHGVNTSGADVGGQNASGCAARVVGRVRAAVRETVVTAVRSHDVALARAKDMQLRVAPGRQYGPAAAQRQDLPADEHGLQALGGQCVLKPCQHGLAAICLEARQSRPDRFLPGEVVRHDLWSSRSALADSKVLSDIRPGLCVLLMIE